VSRTENGAKAGVPFETVESLQTQVELSVLLVCLLVTGVAAWRYRDAIEGALLCLSERLSTLVRQTWMGKD
jgi:hypothetical protein